MREVGNPSPRSRWLVKQMNSPLRGSGVTSPAAGMRHLPARRIPASSKDASSALVHLDLPHGSVEGAIGWKFAEVGALWIGWIAMRSGKRRWEKSEERQRSFSPIACHSPYIAVATRQFREPLLRG